MEETKDPMYYNYAVKQFLVKDNTEFGDINEYSQICLCIYKINKSGKAPFLEFLLVNNGFNLLNLPILPINIFVRDKLVSYSKVFISGILEVDNFEDLGKNIEFDGFYEFNKNLYMFFDITNCNINIDETYSYSPVRFSLTDEILNHKNVCNIPISSDTYNFFKDNLSISFLFDKNEDTYEIPIVGYVGKKTPQQLNFTYMFGESPKDKLSMFGSKYYFTDFKNAVRNGGWSNDYKPEYLYNKLITDNENGRYIKGGLVRFALFMGNTKYIENSLDSSNDESEIKKNRINDTTINQKYEMLTLRITDYDAIWTKTHDSLYLGNVELDDGSFIQEYPIIVTKDYNQQVPLSSHFINKNIGDKFNSCYDYTIL